MQILNLTYLGKICPEISSGIVFAEEEWKVLCCCARKSKEIPESYSLKEAIYDLGVLGGTKGAPSDGMPGVRSIWQGLDTETCKEDMRMIEETKKWVLSPERKAPKATREYAAHRLDGVLDKFLKTMQSTAARLQEKLLKPEVRQKGKEQVKEKARDSVLQLLNRLQAEQAQNKPAAQPRTQEGHSEI